LQAFYLIALNAVHLQNELPFTVTPSGQLLAPHLQSVNSKQKCSGGLLIAIIMGILVHNTITKVNNHFGPYHNNEAKSTHGLNEIFCLE
jgi:hypothetical protein